MSTHLQQYYRKKARGELREAVLLPLLFFAANAIYLLVHGLLSFSAPEGLPALVAAIAFGSVTVGLYQGRTWTRWPAIALIALEVAHWLARHAAEDLGPGVFTIFLHAVIAAWLALPSTGRLFEAAAPSDG